ncbi:Gfo/Idh/MocA family protein [Catenuloplanes atrovinosus]|uniref:Dehydrogenase n=1 Tax=Catenuloplanes atrovinosus TaxID=137266 RepID=A0AAE3YV22_9ACTN|nr:Gfo/Idh/MocA family oxidoreductase [Catenuloplanes atrovinosus]MDR7280418.1 putative dehydrogenase [Catenuloplanes atrovinosus]
MNDRPVRWGILATGGIAASFVEDLKLLPDAEVVAVGSRSPESARAFAGTHDIPRAHGTWQELAADPDVDVIYVATPHSAHFEATMLCLDAGKAVLCEKPFTLDRARAERMISRARERNVLLMEAMWTRLNPVVLRAVQLVRDGAIGEVTTVSSDFGVAGPFPPEHRMRARRLGGGALLDLGVYPITIAHLFLGMPDHVRAWAKLGPEGTDENTGIIFGYDRGAVATLTCGMLGATPNSAVISGSAGRITLHDPAFVPRAMTLHRAGAESEVITEDFPGKGYHYEAAEIHRCLRDGLTESPVVPHSLTLDMMGLLDDIRARIGVSYD